MKIEKINDNKIKVMIDKQEALDWNVSFKKISENSPEVQEMFWAAIRLAEKNVDFSVNGAKLFVEAVPETDDDGFGMLITRVCNQEELDKAVNACGYKGRLRHNSLKRSKESNIQGKKYIYKFTSFENVCEAAEVVCDVFNGLSTLYKCDEKFYIYVVLEETENSLEIETLLSEYGTMVRDSQYVHGRLNEYGEIMIKDNAINVLEEYFCCI